MLYSRILVLIGLSTICQAQTPILHYDFNDEADPTTNLGSLGATYDGSIGEGIEFLPFGEGSAVDFDSTDDQWIIPGGDEDAFDLADGDFSVSGIFQTTAADKDAVAGRFLVTKQHVGSEDGWVIGVRPKTGSFQFGISADGQFSINVLSPMPVNDGQPHEFLAVKSGCSIVLYIDGEVADVDRIPSNMGSTAQNDESLVIGGRSIGNQPPFGGPHDEWLGTLDDLKIYDEALIDFSCPADLNHDCSLDILDFVAFQSEWVGQSVAGDCDANGAFDILDFVCFQGLFVAGCP